MRPHPSSCHREEPQKHKVLAPGWRGDGAGARIQVSPLGSLHTACSRQRMTVQLLVTRALPAWTDPLPAVMRPTLAFVSEGLGFISLHIVRG